MDVNLVREDSINAAFRPRQDNVVDLASRDRPGRRRLVEQLFDEHAAALRLFLKGRLIPDDEIEDLVQELFSRLMGVDGLEAKMSASTGSNRSYLLTMANNMIVDLQRKSAVRKAYYPRSRGTGERGSTASSWPCAPIGGRRLSCIGSGTRVTRTSPCTWG